MNDRQHDAAIVQKVLSGDRDCFRELVETYGGIVFHIAYSMTRHSEKAQDAVQEVFYRAYRRLDSFDPSQSFGAWLRRITINYMLDQRKKSRVNAVSLTTEDDQEIPVVDDTYDPREKHYQNEREATILNALDKLPEKYRIILMLRHFENLSYEEIAETLSIPLGTVTTQIHRARNKLAELLQPFQSELST